MRAEGILVEVVSPATFRHFGIAFGHGIPGNLRRRPLLALLLPLFLLTYANAARKAARDADLLHAHWLPSGLVALLLRKPYVVQLWGSDAELGRRLPWLARPVMTRAQLAIAASTHLADAARMLGARKVCVIPSGVDLPELTGEAVEPPHVLYVGRLSREKGILDFLEATEGLARVIVGDGPLRSRVPEAVGFVPHSELGDFYARASVVCVPSRREGYGVVAREAMAHGRPVVATAVGGLVDAVRDGETGALVQPGDSDALRAAIVRLLDDPPLRRHQGAAAHTRASEFSWAAIGPRLSSALRQAAATPDRQSGHSTGQEEESTAD